MNENAATAKVIKFLNSVDECYARKRHGGKFMSGDPDIAGAARGVAFFIEMKATDGKLTDLQAAMLDRWRAAGAWTAVGVWDDEAKFIGIIRIQSGDKLKWAEIAGPVDKLSVVYSHLDSQFAHELVAQILSDARKDS